MVNQTKQRKMRRSTSKKTKSRTHKHANRRVSRSNKMRGGAANAVVPGFQPNQSFNKGSNPLPFISGDDQVDAPQFFDIPSNINNIEVYYSDSLPESDTSLWTREHKVFPATNANNKYYQTDAYIKYIPIIKNNKLPAPNKTYNINPNLYGVGGSITFTLSFYGIHKQTNLPILLMTKENSNIGYLFAKLL